MSNSKITVVHDNGHLRDGGQPSSPSGENDILVDANRRVGAAVGLVFLSLNRFEFHAQKDDFAEMLLAVAWGERINTSKDFQHHREVE